MTILLLLLFYLLICSITNSRYVFMLNSLIISILIGFRTDNIGTDTGTYKYMYSYIGENGYAGYPEPLYGYLNYILYNCGVSFHNFQYLLSVTILLLFILSIKKYSSRINFSLFLLYALFFVFYAMNITRQILAVLIVLYGYTLLHEAKKMKFVFCVLVASLFHYTAIISLVVLFVRKINFCNKTLFYGGIFLTLLVGMLLNESIFKSILGPYAIYLNTDGSGVRDSVRLLQALLLCTFWSILCVFIYVTAKRAIIDSFWFKIYFTGILLNNLTLNLELGLRIVMFFSISQVIVYVLYIDDARITSYYIPPMVIVTFLLIFFLVFLINGSVGVVPYTNLYI